MYSAAEPLVRPTVFSRRKFTATSKQLTADVARELIAYDPETGALTWKQSPRYGIPAGAKVGVPNLRGYIQITLLGFKYTGHRLAWLIHHGQWPQQVIDHINGDKADNRITNLRDVSQAVNVRNRRSAQVQE